MTPALLDRGSRFFRRGYHDARKAVDNSGEYSAGTFAAHDYAEGRDAYEAEANAQARRDAIKGK